MMKPLHTIHGVVQHGSKRGKAIGYPTINLQTEEHIADGIYLSQTLVDNTLYNSLTFIGVAKTFDAKDYLAETYILDFDKDLYGESMTISLLKKIRDNKKFETVPELVEQIDKDITVARKYFLSISHKTQV